MIKSGCQRILVIKIHTGLLNFNNMECKVIEQKYITELNVDRGEYSVHKSHPQSVECTHPAIVDVNNNVTYEHHNNAKIVTVSACEWGQNLFEI